MCHFSPGGSISSGNLMVGCKNKKKVKKKKKEKKKKVK